jgi:hypothetical protein
VADAAHEIVAFDTSRHSDATRWPERVRATFDLIDRLSADIGVHHGALHAIAIGVPGWGDRCRAAGAAGTFAERFGASVTVDNNVRFAELAEALHSHPRHGEQPIVTIAPTLLRQVASTITYELSWLPDYAPVIRTAHLTDDGGALGAIAALFHESPVLASYPETAVAPPGSVRWPRSTP